MKTKIINPWRDQELSFGLGELHDLVDLLLHSENYVTITESNFDMFEYIYNYNWTLEDIHIAKKAITERYQEDELFKLIVEWKIHWTDDFKYINKRNRTGEVIVWSIFHTLKQTK